ncbi:hypothetical protein ATCC90586_005632 [Pythium insidiosum]|nr:hypothetical protein ATCC90586_005632 [Pythium insidiosum]
MTKRASAWSRRLDGLVGKCVGPLQRGAAKLRRLIASLAKRLPRLGYLSLLARITGKPSRARRARVAWLLLRAVVRWTQRLARVRRRRRRRDAQCVLAPLVATRFVHELLESEQTERLCRRVARLRRIDHQRACVLVLEQAWRAYEARRQHRERRRDALLALVASGREQAAAETMVLATKQRVCQELARVIALSAVDAARQRLAAVTIQRLWRGTRARRRVQRIRSSRRRRAIAKVERHRARQAHAALSTKSAAQEAQDKARQARIDARHRASPLVAHERVLTRSLPMARRRASLLEPLGTQHQPPRLSMWTGARTLPVSMRKFQRIQATRARVNALNLWVAVPIAHTASEQQQQQQQDRPLSKPKRRTAHWTTSYDWVPAVLLLQQQAATSTSDLANHSARPSISQFGWPCGDPQAGGAAMAAGDGAAHFLLTALLVTTTGI